MLKKYKIILAVSFSALFIGVSVFFIDYFLKLRQVQYQKAILVEDSFADAASNSLRILGGPHEGGRIHPGDSVRYAVDLKNSGTLDAEDIRITVEIPGHFSFHSSDLAEFEISGNELMTSLEGLSPGQSFAFSLDLVLKDVLDSGLMLDNPEVRLQYKKENEKIYQETVLEKRIGLEEPLLVESNPNFNDSYIRIVQKDEEGRFKQTSQVREGSKVYLEILIKNTGNMDAKEISVSLEGLYGLVPAEDGDSLHRPLAMTEGPSSLAWVIDQVAAGAQSFVRLVFEAEESEDLLALAPYMKISSPSFQPRQFSDTADIIRGPSFEGSSITVANIGGGKTYAQDLLGATVILTNASEVLAQDIQVKVELPPELTATEEPLSWKIDQIDPGQSVHLNTMVQVVPDLDSDRNVKCSLRVSAASLSEDQVWDSNQIILSYTVPFEGGAIPIIAIHGIEPEAVGRYELSTETFDYMLRLLKTHGYETITLKDLYDFMNHGKVLPERPVIITSDDGYENIYTHAYPLLLKYDYRMTLFVSTAYIADNPQERMFNEFDARFEGIPRRDMLIWPEIIEMANNGIEIGSHGVYHLHYQDLPFEEVRDNLVDSRQIIEANIKDNCFFFAWPHDSVHPEALAVMGDLGYLGALRYKGGPEHTDSIDFFSIKRVNIESPIPKESYAQLFLIE